MFNRVIRVARLYMLARDSGYSIRNAVLLCWAYR